MKNPLAKKILFLQIKDRDTDAYGKFYDLYVDRIYRFIFFKVNSVAEAHDLTSEVFLKLWQYIKEGKDIKNLNSLVYMIARNSVIDFYRSKSRLTDTLESEEVARMADDKDLAAQKEFDSDLDQILSGLSGLKDEYKEVIILKYLDELSIKEIADVLGKNNGSIRVLLHRAIKALKNSLPE